MIRRPPRSTRTDTLFPYTTLFRSLLSRLLSVTHGGQKRARNFDSTVRKHRGHRRYGEMVGLLLCPRSQDPTCMVQGTMSGEIRNGLRALRLRATIHAPRHHVVARSKMLVRGSEEHRSELQSLLRTSSAVFCL